MLFVGSLLRQHPALRQSPQHPAALAEGHHVQRTCFLVDSSTVAMRWDTFLERVSRLVAPDAPAVMQQQQQQQESWHTCCCCFSAVSSAA
jgi:hypothetical protein